MRVEELRLNNYVYSGVKMVKVKSIHTESVLKDEVFIYVELNENLRHYCVSIDDVKPIELTEEILLKFGFEIDCDEVYKDNVCLEYFNDGLFYSDFSSYRISKEPILYLHQLQNLFFVLSGKELEINGL